MEVVVTARNGEVSERYRAHVSEKLNRLEKHDHRIMRVHVEVDSEGSQHKAATRVELTAFSKGPVIRAEACAEDKMAALDLALDKMAAQMRKASDRRRVHRGRHTPTSVAQALAAEAQVVVQVDDEDAPVERHVGPITVMGDGPLVVREKVHPAEPMMLEQALYEMELVGHDFFLFVDKESGRPSVVYRRRGYDYGVIGLDLGA